MTTLRDSIEIAASREAIWRALFAPASYRLWAAEFSPGASLASRWREGDEIIFSDSTGSGLAGIIQEYRANDYLSVRYVGTYDDGRIETGSDEARLWVGLLETYALAKIEDDIRLEIRADLPNDFCDEMTAAWGRALVKIKQLAEQGGDDGAH